MNHVAWMSAGPAVLAHRGGAALGEENSLEVLALARAAGADAVEIDVQEIAGGEIVLLHDAFVVDGDAWRWVRELTRTALDEIVGASVSLAELLARIAETGLGLYLEVKAVSPAGIDRIIDAVVDHGLAGRTVIGSFRHDVPARVATDGRVAASVLFRDPFLDPLALASDLGCSVLHPCFDGNEGMIDLMRGEWIERLHERQLKVVGWNTNDAETMTRMTHAGFDVLCTDDPRIWQSP